MAKRCELCGKGPVVGRQHSHANNVSARRFEPNLQAVKVVVNGGNEGSRECTRCLRPGKGGKDGPGRGGSRVRRLNAGARKE